MIYNSSDALKKLFFINAHKKIEWRKIYSSVCFEGNFFKTA